MSRLIQWKQDRVSVRTVSLNGVRDNDHQECEPSYAFVYAGHGETDMNGVWRIRLRDVQCQPPGLRHGTTPSVVATPTFGSIQRNPAPPAMPPPPCYLVALVFDDDISIHSFQPNGERMPHVPFSWHCVFEGEPVE